MQNLIPDGVWPTMLTPFTEGNEIDYNALASLVDWYIEEGVCGLFAVCQSSEMYHLNLKERTAVAKFVKEHAKGRVPVIASGHISDSLRDQVEELKAMADTGIDALVIVSNHFAGKENNDDVWKQTADRIMNAIPDIPLGIYECPVPYKRVISPELLHWCARTGRFYFLKDTCCDLEQIAGKYKAVEGTNIKIFNANSATLLESLKIGIAGFSGVMANFHPDLYVWLVEHWREEPEKARKVQDFLGFASLAEQQMYPVNAKYYLQLNGIPVSVCGRTQDGCRFDAADRMIMEQLKRTTEYFRETELL